MRKHMRVERYVHHLCNKEKQKTNSFQIKSNVCASGRSKSLSAIKHVNHAKSSSKFILFFYIYFFNNDLIIITVIKGIDLYILIIF